MIKITHYLCLPLGSMFHITMALLKVHPNSMVWHQLLLTHLDIVMVHASMVLLNRMYGKKETMTMYNACTLE